MIAFALVAWFVLSLPLGLVLGRVLADPSRHHAPWAVTAELLESSSEPGSGQARRAAS